MEPNKKTNGHKLLPPLHETSGETRVFNLPKPRVPSQYVYLLLCVSVGTTERYFSWVKCDVSTGSMFLIEMFLRTCKVSRQRWFTMRLILILLFVLKAALTCFEGPVYVSVWFNQVVLKDCIILSYVSELCSIMFLCFTQHCFDWSFVYEMYYYHVLVRETFS